LLGEKVFKTLFFEFSSRGALKVYYPVYIIGVFNVK
jgi:hypothetical protein